MKGFQGLFLAIALGVAGALFNFAYLSNKAKDVEKVNFIGVKAEVVVGRGERLSEQHLEPVGIPKRSVGNLADFAIPYADLQTVLGVPVWRTLNPGSLLLREDLKTPPQELNFGQTPGVDERATWIPVDTRTFVPSLVVPGDQVSFLVSKTQTALPTPAADAHPEGQPGESRPAAANPTGATEIIGPFKVLSLGNRLGTADVMKAAKIPQVQENVMTISVKIEEGQLEPKAQKLENLLRATNFRQVGILLHPRKKDR